MEHQRHLEKTKYRQWVKAVLGLGYVREGLLPFCEEIVHQHHTAIKKKLNLSTIICGHCTVRTLKPDHACSGNKQCPLGQTICNCCSPSNKIACPKNVCGAIYDAITECHGSRAPYWSNTNAEEWCTDPWSIAKCFICASGYKHKISSVDIDCSGSLHIIINNQYFHDHIMHCIDGNDPFSKVRQHRNTIFHSCIMELEEKDANRYIDYMIAVLQDGKELNNRNDTKTVVKKLQDLKNEQFIITTKNETDVFQAAIESLNGKIADVSETLQNAYTSAVEDLQRRVTTLEEKTQLETDRAKKQKLYNHIKDKLEYQKKLISHYEKNMLRVSTMSFEPDDKQCDFNDVYVRQCMISETKGNRSRSKQENISSMSDIFQKEGKSVKSILVLGEAGSGKTFFCKSLINCWCLAHSADQENNMKNVFGGIKEMKKFEFVFYIALRHYKFEVTINKMLKKQYDNAILKPLLNKECANILIVLDGLDELSPKSALYDQCQTGGFPLDHCKDYTVLFTSRLWHKMYTNKIKHTVALRGFDNASVNDIIEKTVIVLNETFNKTHTSQNCKNELNDHSFNDIRHIPFMLQHLICLWFDGKLNETSKCVINTRMLDLIFVWNGKKSSTETLLENVRENDTSPMEELPNIFTELSTRICMANKHLIRVMSELAFETIYNEKQFLKFDDSIFGQLNISNDERACCLELGILTVESCPSLSASESHRSSFSFVHMSEHEFLAAIHIAIKFKSSTKDNVITNKNCGQFLLETCKLETTNDIFEHANVLIMLCGIEPEIAAPMSKYVQNVCLRDKYFQKYRGNIDSLSPHYKRVFDLQQFIQNCIKEVGIRGKGIKQTFYLGDIVVDDETVHCYVPANLDKENVSSDNVLSFRIDIQSNAEYLGKIFKNIPKCRHLEAVFIHLSDYYPNDTDDINYDIYETFDIDASFLKSVSISFSFENKYNAIPRTIIHPLIGKQRLNALNMEGVNLTHTNCNALCTFISENGCLEQISLKIMCECKKQHELDLAQHNNLQYLHFDNQIVVKSCNASSLQRFRFPDLNKSNYMTIFETLKTANNLSELELGLGSGLIESESITSDLVKLLRSLRQMFQLKLRNFAFKSSIFSCSAEMVNMKHIYLYDVRMTEVAWRAFVDILCDITHHLNVHTRSLCITQDEKIYRSSDEGINYLVGLQYVLEKREYLNVAVESNESFNVSSQISVQILDK